MNEQMDELKLVIVAEFEPVIAYAEDGQRYAYVKVTTPSGESVNLNINSVETACQCSGALLDLADALAE